jgi:putative addiction module component (TIGR02574 family)
MTKEAAELLKQALALTERERADLACTLMDSLDTAVDENVEVAWQEETRRRIEDVRSGKVSLVPWDDVRERARRVLDEPAKR